MPDHLHAIVALRGCTSTLSGDRSAYKMSRDAWRVKRTVRCAECSSAGFYDRIVRDEVELAAFNASTFVQTQSCMREPEPRNRGGQRQWRDVSDSYSLHEPQVSRMLASERPACPLSLPCREAVSTSTKPIIRRAEHGQHLRRVVQRTRRQARRIAVSSRTAFLAEAHPGPDSDGRGCIRQARAIRRDVVPPWPPATAAFASRTSGDTSAFNAR